MNNARPKVSTRVAFGSMAAALSLVIMLLGGVMLIATYAAPLACALLLIPVRIESGRRDAWLVWLAVSLLSMILGLDKEAAFFYIFIGWYPIVKWDLDQHVRSRRLRLPVKAALFLSLILVMYALLGAVLRLDAVLEDLAGFGTGMRVLFVLVLTLCLLLYDRLLGPLTLFYAQRLRPRLRLTR